MKDNIINLYDYNKTGFYCENMSKYHDMPTLILLNAYEKYKDSFSDIKGIKEYWLYFDTSIESISNSSKVGTMHIKLNMPFVFWFLLALIVFVLLFIFKTYITIIPSIIASYIVIHKGVNLLYSIQRIAQYIETESDKRGELYYLFNHNIKWWDLILPKRIIRINYYVDHQDNM